MTRIFDRDSYVFHRANGKLPADSAVARARADHAAGKSRWPLTGLASYQNKPNDRGGRWIERPDLAGIRFVGFTDDLIFGHHRGWFTDDGYTDVIRGAVYQLPARHGRAVYIQGVITGESLRSGFSEQSTGGTDAKRMPAILFLGELHTGAAGGASHDFEDIACDVARWADREAEMMAEDERSYREANAAGFAALNAVHDAGVERKNARELLAELRGKKAGDMPASCTALRGLVREHSRRARRLYAKAAKLWDEWANVEGFKDGAEASDYWEMRRG